MRQAIQKVLLAGAAAALLTLTVIGPTAAQIPITSCPYVPGYRAAPDYTYESSELAVAEDSFEAARAACDANPSCLQYNNAFATYTTLPLKPKISVGTCTYVKSTGCPVVPGYIAYPAGVTWDTTTDGTKSVEAGAAAKATCDADRNCLSWNSEGWVASGLYSELEFVAAASPSVCTYVPQPCPSKFGFWYFPYTSLRPTNGFDGVNFGSLGNQEDAEAYCRITPRCTAFSSGGDYAVGGWSLSDTGTDKCLYVKQPCPPLVNYTVYDGVTNDRADFPPDGRYANLCFSDMARNCSGDPDCMVFDLLRYVWRNDVVQYNSYPGMCLYRKVTGLLPSNSALRRRAAQEAVAADDVVGSGGNEEVKSVPHLHVLQPYRYLQQAMHLAKHIGSA